MLLAARDAVAQGRQAATALVEAALEAARAAPARYHSAVTQVFAERARLEARHADERIHLGLPARALEGMPINVKDLFDVAGTVTLAGSTLLRNAAPAMSDAPCIARLRGAGAIIVGKTNMTEFAYSGLGLNPHYGTPANPCDALVDRIPGGSSSGAAVSVATGMAIAALGTDTGGSVRIPAALCGLTGWKPSARRITREGVFPLSPSLDSVGVIARTVLECALLDAVLTGEPPTIAEEGVPPRGLRLAVPRDCLAGDLDDQVAASFDRALEILTEAGVECRAVSVPELTGVPGSGAGPILVAAEAYAYHRQYIERDATAYDPRVRARIERGRDIRAIDYLEARRVRAAAISAVRAALEDFDGWLMPTVPTVAPALVDLSEDTDYFRVNGLMLRNPSVVNFIDGCAVSMPCHAPDGLPTGLSLAGVGGTDQRLLRVAQTLQALLAARGLGAVAT